MISNELKNKSALSKATLKGREIAKIKRIERTRRSKFDIEIVDIKAMDRGVEVFARAWNQNGQIGFGKDGTVDIERFRIFNPPILVEDPLGNIVRAKMEKDTGEVKQSRFREDVKEVLLSDLEHTISVKKEVSDDSKIIKGRIGSTTTTVYPDADTESTSVDGSIENDGVNDTWANVRGGAGTGSQDSQAENIMWRMKASTTTDQWADIWRGFFLFDTSAIADTDVISSATLSLYGKSKADTLSAAGTTNIYTSNPASNTALVAGDFDSVGTAAQCDTAVTYADWTSSGYNDFAFNATGIGNIDKTGVSKFSAYNANYDAADSPPTWSSGQSNLVQVWYADEAGTSKDPKLVIEHSSVAANTFRNFFNMVEKT